MRSTSWSAVPTCSRAFCAAVSAAASMLERTAWTVPPAPPSTPPLIAPRTAASNTRSLLYPAFGSARFSAYCPVSSCAPSVAPSPTTPAADLRATLVRAGRTPAAIRPAAPLIVLVRRAFGTTLSSAAFTVPRPKESAARSAGVVFAIASGFCRNDSAVSPLSCGSMAAILPPNWAIFLPVAPSRRAPPRPNRAARPAATIPAIEVAASPSAPEANCPALSASFAPRKDSTSGRRLAG